MLTPNRLKCEYRTNPIGLDVRQPRLSWQSQAAQRDAWQTAYQILADERPDALEAAACGLWDSGKVASDASVHVPYAGTPLQPGQRAYWRVRVWDENDTVSEWSEIAFWETGLLDSANWQADWITPDWDEDTGQSQPVPLLRRTFAAGSDIAAARIYATSLGLYELRLNGERVGDAVLTPGWTSYETIIQYQTYDVTALVREGDNTLGAQLGDGWYRGHMGLGAQRNLYGEQAGLLLQLQITYADGRSEIMCSDTQWRATPGPIRMSDIYMGEDYDARLEKPGWDLPAYDDGDWHGVRLLDHGKDMLVAQAGPLVTRHETIRPVRIIESPKGETIFDFGQNMVGWVRVQARGAAGTQITLRHAEVLDQEGNLYTENLRKAKQTTSYILKGTPGADEVYAPHFTFQGFQYVAVEGLPGEPTLDALTGIVLHSDTPPTGRFECSNPMINQLQHNIVWGQKGNFVDVPTDCPQRDERLGWTADTQVFARTACYNMDVATFYTKWLRDLSADQQPNGSVPHFVPEASPKNRKREPGMFGGGGAAVWGDAAVICPWTVYLCYGDTRLLEEQYDSMAGWVDYVHGRTDADSIWRQDFQFGDWLDYRGRSPMSPAPVTNTELLATACLAYISDLLSKAAGVLGKTDDETKYAALAQKVKTAFCSEFVTPGGRVGPNSQTAYVLALHFDVLPEEMRAGAAARLAEEVRKAGYHLTTGFSGTPYLCHVLSRYGYTDVAYELMNQESYPSWLYPVKMGATTIWERWDGIKPDGSFQDAGMNSFNHYAYGAIGEWLYRVVAGIEIDPDAPGYKHVLFQPQPGGGLDAVRATLDTPYGPIAAAWELTDETMRVQVTVPPNAHATVRLPGASLDAVTEGGRPLATGNGIRSAGVAGDAVLIEVGSGTYAFVTSGLNRAQAMEGVRHVAGRLDVYSSLRDLLANEATKAVLVEHLGETLFEGPRARWIMDTSLAQIAERMRGMLPPEKMEAIGAAISAIA